MAVKEDYSLEEVIEVINLNNATLGIELAGIRTNISILLNSVNLTEGAVNIVENNDLLKLLLKILNNAFNCYIMNENLYNFILIKETTTNFSYFYDFKANVNELILNIHELAKYEGLEEVPEVYEMKNITAVNLDNNIKKLATCYEILN